SGGGRSASACHQTPLHSRIKSASFACQIHFRIDADLHDGQGFCLPGDSSFVAKWLTWILLRK
ncbi:hypothetical protein, partial [Enterobacter asburiae]|uniref:hypothetical protein n=1 Tax=Enterobacter asburiae TaxID=61645 RepID=UPI001F21799F